MYTFLWPVRIVGVSMEPTLKHGDRIFVSRAASRLGSHDRSDLIMTRIYDDSGGRYIIKRIIAKPGDTLVIENGLVSVNGESVEFGNFDYVLGSVSVTLDDDYYFLIGDNHMFSTDSRYFGEFHRRDIKGGVLFRFFGGNIRI